MLGPHPHRPAAQVVDQDTGMVEVVGSSAEAVALARRTIERLLEDAEEGRVYRCGCSTGFLLRKHRVVAQGSNSSVSPPVCVASL